MHRSYLVGGSRFGVRTTSPAFGAWLDAVLGSYRIDETLPPEYSIVIDGGRSDPVVSGRRFHVLWQGVGQVTRTLHVETLARSLLAEIEARLLADLDDPLFVHFAAVRSGPHVALIPAWIIAYVQAAGRRVERAGLTLPYRRWVAVDPTTGVVVPSPDRLDVPADAVQRLDGWTGGEDPHRSDVLEPVVADAVVTYVEGMETVDLGNRAIALHRVAGAAANLPKIGESAVRALGRTIGHARAYEIGLGRPAQMVEALAAVAAHERAHGDEVTVGSEARLD